MSGTDKFSAFFWHHSQDSVFSAGAAPAPLAAQPFSLTQPLFSVQPARLLSSYPQLLKATKGSFSETLFSPPLPTSSTPYRPRLRELQGVLREAPGSSPRLRFRKRLLHPNNPAPLSGTRTVGCGWGAQLGQGQFFQRGRKTGPRNIPLSRKFPFRGHGVCARMARGAGGGGVGVDRVSAGAPHPGKARRKGQATRSAQEAAPPRRTQGCHKSLTLHTPHPQPEAYRTPPLVAL